MQKNGRHHTLRRIIHDFLRPNIGRIMLAIVFMLIVAGTQLINIRLMKELVDKVLVEKSSYQELYFCAFSIFALAAIKGAADYMQTVLMTVVGQRVVTDIQVKLFKRIMYNDLDFFNKTPAGQLVSRFTIDANLMRNAATQSLVAFGRDALTVVGLAVHMFYTDWALALISFIFFPCAILPIQKVSRRMRKVSTNFQEEMGRFNSMLNQAFQGARHVKAYNMEEREIGDATSLAERVYKIVERVSVVRSAASPLMETIGGMSIAAIFLYGGHQVIAGTRSAGDFVSFVGALLFAYAPFKSLAGLQINLQEGLAAADRIFHIMDIEPAIGNRENAQNAVIEAGKIIFDSVHFQYESNALTLQDICLEVPAGKKIALVGPSGSGKSTMLNLIPRFYDVTSGRVLIDGIDVRDMTLKSLRSSIGLVSQETGLFDDTIRSNISYGKKNASMSEIMSAAQSAAAHDFILELPFGYETVIGESGVRLSGGQRQRIAIARAMLKNAPILLLDEATSALDTKSERLIQEALRRLTTGRTSIVVAHRLSTIIDADLIYVIDRGKIVEFGTHADLMKLGKVYENLWRLQFSDMPETHSGAQRPSGLFPE